MISQCELTSDIGDTTSLPLGAASSTKTTPAALILTTHNIAGITGHKLQQ